MTARARYHHTMVEGSTPAAPPAVPNATLRHLKGKAMVANVRGLQAQQKADALQHQVDDLTARLAKLEPPATPTEPNRLPVARVESTPSAPAVSTAADATWIIDDWRQDGWRS